MKHSNAKLIQKTHLLKPDEYICSKCFYSTINPFCICPGCGSKMKNVNYDPNWVDEMEFMDIFFDD